MLKRFLLICFVVILLTGASIIESGLTDTSVAAQSYFSANSVNHEQGIIPPAQDYQIIEPVIFEGDLRDLPGDMPATNEPSRVEAPLKYIPGQEPKLGVPLFMSWLDPVHQELVWKPVMPGWLLSFDGMRLDNGGAGWPPDPDGDVGLEHYIQVVNTSIAIYEKATGVLLWQASYNDFFTGPINTPCDTANRGDPIVLFDPYVNRWLVTDFAWYSSSGPFYECIAVSRGANPLTDGWYFYALLADTGIFTGYVNDYPKLGVWSDGWYMSANMFQQVPPFTGFGVRLWALDREAMIRGESLRELHFDICLQGTCDSLLPANLRGTMPPVGTPEYFLSVSSSNLNLWKMYVNWNAPETSMLVGPIQIPIAPFSIASSIPQKDSPVLLDSLSYRLMHALQFRKIGHEESLWAIHTVNHNGFAALRWYQINTSGVIPELIQEGTYQPDDIHRWMGSLAVDKDGNMAVGYSASNSDMYPEIRINGRLYGELPGSLTQGETVLIAGSGSQTRYSRWGDYTRMMVDPVDDCTFWYTNEYYAQTGTNWHTRIGSFRYPTCDRPKGKLTGSVLNSENSQPVSGVAITATSPELTLRSSTGSDGVYTLLLPAGIYTLTAGPLKPGYPFSTTVEGVTVITDSITVKDVILQAYPYLDGESFSITNSMFPNNGFLEPGNKNDGLLRTIKNTGAALAREVSGVLISLSPGVTVSRADVLYPQVQPGETVSNLEPYLVSLENSVPCGSGITFMQVITASTLTFTNTLTVNASVPLPDQPAYLTDVENGYDGWVYEYPWDITGLRYHSPSHSWTDSPAGNYSNNVNVSLVSPVIDLEGKENIHLTGWMSYDLETGYDYLLVEYSQDGGVTWGATPLKAYTGQQFAWQRFDIPVPQLTNVNQTVIRFRLTTDVSVVRDGVYLDDIAITYEPFVCRRFIFSPLYR